MKRIDFISTQEMRYKRYDYEAYLEDCEEMECNPADENSQEFYDWVDFMVQTEIDYFFENLSGQSIDTTCVITGKLGLWNGNPEIEPKYKYSVVDAIHYCLQGSDDFDISADEWGFIVSGHHHDGTNVFRISVLSDTGLRRFYKYGKVSSKRKENIIKLDMLL